MTEGPEPAAFAGVDWATEEHDVCIVDLAGCVLGERAFKADAEGLAAMAQWLVAKGGGPENRIPVAIEVPHGVVVETLLERGFPVHSLNPKQLDRFRDRFSAAGAKDDRRDARVLADSLRTDGRAFRRLDVDDPDVILLREWTRSAEQTQCDDLAACNRVRQQLLRFFPQALELSEDLGAPWFLALMEAVPTPQDAHRFSRARISHLLRRHRIRKWDADEVLEILRKPAVTVAPGTVEAATSHLRLLFAQIRLLRGQLAECRANAKEILDRLRGAGSVEEEGRKDEPLDVEILLSLPGAGRIVAATVLAEASRPLRDRDYQALRTLGGVAPVTRSTGKQEKRRKPRWCQNQAPAQMRYACNARLRKALYHAAAAAAQHHDEWKPLYAELRGRGHSHARACRGLADRLLNVLMAMLRTRSLYDPSKRLVRRVAA